MLCGSLFTVTVNVPVPVLFAASRAVIVTVVVPIGNTVPLFCEYVWLVTPTASVALPAAYVTVAPAALVASTVTLPCAATTGAVVSRTVTVKFPVPTLFAASLAVIVTVVVPIGNTVPLFCE
jgi:hypothetical protein